MSMPLNLALSSNHSSLSAFLASESGIIETELAERSLKAGLFASLASSELARTVAWNTVALLRISLEAGNLSQFRRQIEWEIRVALNHHNLFKLESDLALVALLEKIMLERSEANLVDQIKSLMAQVRALFEDCWQTARFQQLSSNREN